MARQRTMPFIYLLLGLASIFIITWGIQSSAFVLNPILLAAVITVVVLPVPQKLTKRGLPGWLSFVLTLLAVVGVLALVIVLVFVSIGQISSDLASQASVLGEIPDAEGEDGSLVSGLLSPAQMNQLWSLIVRVGGQAVFLAFIVLIIFIFMLSAAITTPAADRLGLSSDSPVMNRVAQLTEDVRRYMSIMTGVNFLVGAGDAIFLMILGVDYAILWGLLAWFMGYIPSIGFWIAMIPPLVLAWAQGGVQLALFVLVGYVLINGSVQNFLQPRMMGQGLGISPVVVFISLFVWGWLLGGVGAILAVPLTMIMMSVLDSFDNTRWIATLMSVTPEHKGEDHQDAQARLRGVWDNIGGFFTGQAEGEDTADNDTV